MYLVKTPFWLRWVYPSLIWRSSAKDKQIYLTFDDGPIPVVTPFVLDILKKYNAKATFFCIGDNIQKYPEIFKRVGDDGHLIGNHTYNHLRGWDTPTDEYCANMLKCQRLTQTDLFRPPHGRIKKTQISKIRSEVPGLRIIMWDVLSGDFDQDLQPEKCFQNVIRNTEAGSIVVFHDSLKAQPRLEHALPKALEYWQEKGYTFQTL